MTIVDNIQIVDKDNKFVGYTSVRKSLWFVKKNLGEFIDEKLLQIYFTPKKYPDINNATEYKIENLCVVCGYNEYEIDENNENYAYTILNHTFVVPSEMVKLYPNEVRKKQRSTKKIIICDTCLSKYDKIKNDKKNELYKQYNITLDKSIVNLKKLIKTYKSNKQVDKSECIKQIEKIINKRFSDNDINTYLQINPYKNIDNMKHPDEYIVNSYIRQNKLNDFESIWVELFLEKMQPKFLLKNWKELFYQE